jgi:hypothetical protein
VKDSGLEIERLSAKRHFRAKRLLKPERKQRELERGKNSMPSEDETFKDGQRGDRVRSVGSFIVPPEIESEQSNSS